MEKLLKELGASGVGLHELVGSISHILGDPLQLRMRYIITVRNKLVHEHDYTFDDNEVKFVARCDEVISKLSALRSAQRSRAEIAAAKPTIELPKSNPPAPIHKRRRRPILKRGQLLRAFLALSFIAAMAVGFQLRKEIARPAKSAWQATLIFYTNLTAAKPEQSKPPQTPARYATVAEAQKAAMKKYPALRVAGSDFNKRFLALHSKYRKERPGLFHDNNWPVSIADEVAASSK
jgi:hypothetical protein